VNADDAAYYLQASADATINSLIYGFIQMILYPDIIWSGNYYSYTRIFEDYVYSLKMPDAPSMENF
jgi:hypothetical protein